MTHTGHLRRRNWRPDDNQNRAYPSRQTVQPDGSTSRTVAHPTLELHAKVYAEQPGLFRTGLYINYLG